MGADYPTIVKSWRSNWERIVPFFEYPPEIRRIIYTTNDIESVNMSLRKVTKSRGSFPSDEALLKLFYLALNNISKKWTMPLRDWKAALTRFTIQLEAGCPRTDHRPVYTKLCTPSYPDSLWPPPKGRPMCGKTLRATPSALCRASKTYTTSWDIALIGLPTY